MNKINYNTEMENKIKEFHSTRKPKLLLHSCCGPCSSAVIERLMPYFQLTVFYYNPNIDTEEEYKRRAMEQEEFIEKMKWKDVNLLVEDFNPSEYVEAIKGWEEEKEGGKRCTICFQLRLKKTAKVAKKLGYDFFTTTLSVSPHKNSQLLNVLGKNIGKCEGVEYLPSDFKKKGGYARSVELSNKFQMYRQDYCGCIYSKREREARENEKK